MNIPRSKLPVEVYAVPVTISVLVEGRGIDQVDREADAKDQAAKWAGNACREVGTPKVLGR